MEIYYVQGTAESYRIAIEPYYCYNTSACGKKFVIRLYVRNGYGEVHNDWRALSRRQHWFERLMGWNTISEAVNKAIKQLYDIKQGYDRCAIAVKDAQEYASTYKELENIEAEIQKEFDKKLEA